MLSVAEADVDFPNILRVYDALETWIEAHRLVCVGSPVEVWPAIESAALDIAYPVVTR